MNNSDLVCQVIGFVILAIMVLGGFVAWHSEKKDWNHGFCSECNEPWESFDRDSQGGRGYKCGCGKHIWISYPGVDKKRNPGKNTAVLSV